MKKPFEIANQAGADLMKEISDQGTGSAPDIEEIERVIKLAEFNERNEPSPRSRMANVLLRSRTSTGRLFLPNGNLQLFLDIVDEAVARWDQIKQPGPAQEKISNAVVASSDSDYKDEDSGEEDES